MWLLAELWKGYVRRWRLSVPEERGVDENRWKLEGPDSSRVERRRKAVRDRTWRQPRAEDMGLTRPLRSLITPSIALVSLLLYSLSTTHSLYIMPVKKRCQFWAVSEEDPEKPVQCNSPALRIVGECPHCKAFFCAAHRLPEHHNCSKLEDCRQQAFDRNKSKLESERTIASKMATA